MYAKHALGMISNSNDNTSRDRSRREKRMESVSDERNGRERVLSVFALRNIHLSKRRAARFIRQSIFSTLVFRHSPPSIIDYRELGQKKRNTILVKVYSAVKYYGLFKKL